MIDLERTGESVRRNFRDLMTSYLEFTNQNEKNSAIVSIILCTFNRKRLVQHAIASVFDQTYPFWQMIIVDDGSTDNSDEALLSIAKQDGRIMYVRHHNKGLALSRNVGAALASAKYITFLDSDDVYKKNHIEQRVNYMESHPSVDAIHGGLVLRGEKSKQLVPDVTKPGKKIHLSKCYVAGTLFIKRTVFNQLRGFLQVDYGDDYYFFQRLIKNFKLVRVSWPTYVYDLNSEDRLCNLYEKGGVKAILEFRQSKRLRNS